MILFERDAIASALRVADHHALLPFLPDATRTKPHPFRLRVTFDQDGHTVTRSVVPDRLLSLMTSDEQRLNFAVEIDRGKMKVKPRKPSANSNYARKIATYFAAWQQDRHRTQWGFASFRVLTITPSEERIDTMIDTQRLITRDRVAPLFLYTTRARYLQSGPLAPIWRSSEREGIALLERAKGHE